MEFKQANVLPKTYSSVQGNQNNNNNFTAKCYNTIQHFNYKQNFRLHKSTVNGRMTQNVCVRYSLLLRYY